MSTRMIANALGSRSRRYSALLLTMAALVSVLAISGWFLHLRVLVQVVPGPWAMVVSTAAGCLIASVSLFAAGFSAERRGRKIAFAGGTLLVALGLLGVCENIWHVNLGLDMPALHAAVLPEYTPPGRMGLNTALGIILFGLNLVGYAWRQRLAVAAIARYLLVPVFVISLAGIMTRWLDLRDLFIWFNDSGFARLSPLTSATFLLMALAGWQLWDEALRSSLPDEKMEGMRIQQTAAILLTLTAVATGISGVTLLQSRLMAAMRESLLRNGTDDATAIDLQLTQRSDRAAILTNQKMVIDALAAFDHRPADADAREKLQDAAEALLKHGFSAVAFHGAHGAVVEAGHRIADPAISMPLTLPYPSKLLWKDGYLLETAVPMESGNGAAGLLVAQQPLPGLNRLSARANQAGRSGEMSLCAQESGKEENGNLESGDLACFPQRSQPMPFTMTKSDLAGQAPLRKAIAGRQGTMVIEESKRRVLVAYVPIGSLGLSLALRMDTVEILHPARRGLEIAAPLILVLILAGFWAMNRRIKPLIQKLISSREYIRHLATHDALTHLPNRVLLEDRLAVALRNAARLERQAVVMMLDLDHFKQINDSLGHAAGDAVLVEIAARLKQCIRASDTAARFGGDEFVVVLSHVHHPADTALIAQKILVSLNRPMLFEDRQVIVSPSIGAAAFPQDGTDMRTLLLRADQAMYHAKSMGRNNYSAYEAEMEEISALR